MDKKTEKVAKRLLAESFAIRNGAEAGRKVEEDFEGCLIALLILIRNDVASHPGKFPGNTYTKFTVDEARYEGHIEKAHELIEQEDNVPVSV
jgi:hypothetical protein